MSEQDMYVMLKKEEILEGSRKYKQPDRAKGNAVSRLLYSTLPYD